MKKDKVPMINPGHYMSGARFDVWLKLLLKNRKTIRKDRIPQAAYLTAETLLLFPFALLERGLFYLPIKKTKVEKAPLQIIGIWRTGTTNLQYTLAQDPQFGWLDPIHSVTIENSLMLGKVLKPIVKRVLVGARPMDNMEYTIDLPMEDLYSLCTFSTEAFNHMIGFPDNAEEYIDTLYTRELSPRAQKRWKKNYEYLIKKTTLAKGGKQLMLKSPDNSCHIREFSEMYPGTKYIMMARNPYKVIPSITKTFKDMTKLMTFQDMPEDMDIEYYVFDIFTRLNKMMIEDIQNIPEEDIIIVKHEEFSKNPIETLEKIYDHLGLKGFEEAKPKFIEYQNGQKGYKPNKLSLDPRIKKKINERCAFYFDYFGYDMEDVDEDVNTPR